MPSVQEASLILPVVAGQATSPVRIDCRLPVFDRSGVRGQSGDPGVRGTDQKSAGTLVDFPGQVLASRARIVAVTARDARPRGLTDTW
jgi:hypothetical protein